MRIIIFVSLCLLFTTANAKQKYYKWTDENGNVHYSEKKPEDKEAQELKIRSKAPKPQETVSEEANTDKELPPDQQAVEDFNRNEQAKAKEAQDQANCEIAKKNLQTLESRNRVKRVNPATGEEIYMDNNEVEKMITVAKQSIRNLCK
ncbi:MAG: DUF4124 domain-containing protein [Xanthomonadales bacterium]|nr:DUF4124 domain-containing protein [Xanthomonadales bacterium]